MAGKRTDIPFSRARRVGMVMCLAAAMLTTPSVASFTGAASATTLCQVNPGATSWTTADTAKARDGHALFNSIRDIGASTFYNGTNGVGYYGQDPTGKPIDVALIDSGVAPVPGLTAGNVVQGPDLSFESRSPNLSHVDTLGHGTMMASIIAGRDKASPSATDINDPLQLNGVAPKARVVSVKVADSQGAVDVTQVIQAIDWVVEHAKDPVSATNPTGFNIRVINLSYGVASTNDWTKDPLSFAVDQAWKAGITVVAAAGNGGAATYKFSPGLTSPAINQDVIAVGAYDNNGTPGKHDDDFVPPYTSGPSSSNKRTPDFVAPAEHITGLHTKYGAMDDEIQAACLASSNPAAYPATVFGPNDRFVHGSGTSQAAAVTSGAVALMLSKNPKLTPDQIKRMLMTTAVPFGAGSSLSGSGAMNLGATYASIMTPPSYVQNKGPAVGGGSLDNTRGSSVLYTYPQLVPLKGDTDIFGHALWIGSTVRCSGCSWGFEQDETWAPDLNWYPSVWVGPYDPVNGPGLASWQCANCEAWWGYPLLGIGLASDPLRPSLGLVWNSYTWPATNWGGNAWTSYSDSTHTWNQSGYWNGDGNWKRFSLTGSDWTSFSLRDNSWS